MRINISLNEVLRSFVPQFIYTYNKYIETTDIDESEVTNFNLIEHFNFSDVNKLNRFLYSEAPLEIFGHADQISDGLMTHVNQFIVDIEDDGDHTISIVSREVDKSIPATLFFLSKTNCRCPHLNFVKQNSDEWIDADVLITANPIALESKPEGKISVKVKTPYNTNASADYEIDSILDFINDSELRNKILNTITTTYEEL